MHTHSAETQATMTPQKALQFLREGNDRFLGNLSAKVTSSPSLAIVATGVLVLTLALESVTLALVFVARALCVLACVALAFVGLAVFFGMFILLELAEPHARRVAMNALLARNIHRKEPP